MKKTKLSKVLAIALAAVMVFAMLALTACGGGSTDNNGGGETPAGSGAATPAGSGAAAPAATSGTILIGATGPLTGDASSYGISVQQGAQIAIDELNKAGGVGGYQFAFSMKDDKAAAADASTGYDLLFDEGMVVSIGSVTSGSCVAFGQKAAQDGLFFITPSASSADVIATGDTAFRVCFGDPDQGVLAAQELTKKYKKIGCIYDTSDTYSTGIYAAFEEEMKNLNAEFEVRTFDADNKKDFSSQVEALKDCEVIFCPFYYTEASLVARACAAKELDNIVLFGCDGFDGLAPILDENVKNPISQITPFDAEATDEATKSFVEAYQKQYGTTPDQFAADGYDAIKIIANIFETAGVPSTLDIETVGKLCVDTITGSSYSYAGVTGSMTWDKTGACTKVPIIKEIN